MSDLSYYDEAWYDARWTDMPPVMRKVAADAIKKVLDEETMDLIRRKHAEHGHDWIHHLIDVSQEQRDEMNALLPDPEDIEEYGWPSTMSAHHGWGTSVRNLLRQKEGGNIRDDDLPHAPYEDGTTHRNWDDYYVQAIEAAVGLR